MKNLFKKIAGKLPLKIQQELKRLYFSGQIQRGRFNTDEPEYALLNKWVGDGDWVLDIGANIGHYTGKLSSLAGPAGRVLSFEPVPDTFELLAANVSRLPERNVTLFNAAVSNRTGVVGMCIPSFNTGLTNYYMAQLTPGDSDINVFALTIDSLDIPGCVSVIKMDVEGHELQALEGMRKLLERDRPILVVEGTDPDVEKFLSGIGYGFEYIENSSNRIYKFNNRQVTAEVLSE